MTKHLGHGHTSFDYQALFGVKVKLNVAIPEGVVEYCGIAISSFILK